MTYIVGQQLWFQPFQAGGWGSRGHLVTITEIDSKWGDHWTRRHTCG